MKRLHLTFLLVGLLCLPLHAQQSQQARNQSNLFKQALRLYRQGDYAQAQPLFQKIQRQTTDETQKGEAQFYAASSAIRLGQRQADRELLGFVEKYPLSPKRWVAYREVADYYFEVGRYLYALKWYRKVRADQLSRKEEERYSFRMGYCLYRAGKREEAKSYLTRAKETERYGSQAAYYLGFISYEDDDYEGATEQFEEVQDPQLLEEKLGYFQADMNYKLGKFEEAIAQAKSYMPRADREEASELNKLIGESYFQLEQFAEALPFLEQYEGRQGRRSNEDFYQLGYCYYQQARFAEAIESFNRIIESPDALGQNAYYHLGQSYLREEKMTEALNAFRQASSLDFDMAIRREAFLNYAQLSYQIGNAYEPATEVLSTYLQEYPRDENRRDLQRMLLDAYVSSQNFEQALKYLQENKQELDKESRQKIYFFRGLQLFAEEEYAESSELFSETVDEMTNSLWSARAFFWRGEARYRLEQYPSALLDFEAFERNKSAAQTPEFREREYSLAYALFSLERYAEAATLFGQARRVLLPDDPRWADALLRQGDALYASSQYSNAVRTYAELSKSHPEYDYSLFQRAKATGLLGRPIEKMNQLASLEQAFPDSSYRDDALFERAATLAEQGQTQEALEVYRSLIQEYSEGSLSLAARLREILILYSQGHLDEALGQINILVRDYPTSAEATQSVSTAKLIYMDKGEVSAFAAWARDLRFIQLTDTELEEASYAAAEALLDQGKISEAMRACEDYLQSFPLGARSGYLAFQLAELYYGQGQKEEALPYFKRAAETSKQFSEQALTRIGSYYVEEGQLSVALPYLEDLLKTAQIEDNKRFALSNLMKAYFEQGQFERSIDYSERLLQLSATGPRLREDAWLYQARSAMVNDEEERAKKAYEEVIKTAIGTRGAEALFYQAYFRHKSGAFEESNSSVEELARSYASYQEWGARGLIIMARNFDALGDPFQATYILESVIENFGELLPQKMEAESLLQQIKSRQANENSSVNPQNNRP